MPDDLKNDVHLIRNDLHDIREKLGVAAGMTVSTAKGVQTMLIRFNDIIDQASQLKPLIDKQQERIFSLSEAIKTQRWFSYGVIGMSVFTLVVVIYLGYR